MSGSLAQLKMSISIYPQTSAMRIPAERNLTQTKMTKHMQFRICSYSVNRLTGFRDLCWQRSETGKESNPGLTQRAQAKVTGKKKNFTETVK